MTIYYGAPSDDRPSGGIKQLYRHVDILNENGFSAFILHSQKDFRCTWFAHNTRISYAPEFRPDDYLVLPEIALDYVDKRKGVRKVIFNQNAYYTFFNFPSLTPVNRERFHNPYDNPEVIGIMVVSEDNKEYLEYALPGKKIMRIRNGLDISLFNYKPEMKKKQIAFMPRKHSEDIQQVLNILRCRSKLDNWDLIPIDNKSEIEVATILRESSLFMSFGYPEGWPLPPAEAMASGCLVVGYHGRGGREYFKNDFCYPVDQGDIITFARTMELVLDLFETHPHIMREKAREARKYVTENHSLKRESDDVIHFWKELMRV